MHPDTRVRCKAGVDLQSLKSVQFVFDRLFLALQSCCGSLEGRGDSLRISLWVGERRKKIANHGAAEASMEERLDPLDDSHVAGAVEALAT